jgi:hypothetical protein
MNISQTKVFQILHLDYTTPLIKIIKLLLYKKKYLFFVIVHTFTSQFFHIEKG